MTAGWWWDKTWNPVSGCSLVSPGCENCFSARDVATLQTATNIPHYLGITDQINGRYRFNGMLKKRAPGHHDWIWPLSWRGAERPVLGPNGPSLIFVVVNGDLFHEDRPTAIINRVVATIAQSEHIGLLVTKRAHVMANFFQQLHPRTAERWKSKLWLIFSAENQFWFDRRWSQIRPLAEERGWFVGVSLAPLLGPVVLPDDFLRLAKWTIVGGEEGKLEHIRDMELRWARAIRDQCRGRIPFFLKRMTGEEAIPPDLQIWEFPVPTA
jgi:protein gp37